MIEMLVALQILNAILIFAAGILLASRIYPSLFESSDVTGHDYIKDKAFAVNTTNKQKDFIAVNQVVAINDNGWL